MRIVSANPAVNRRETQARMRAVEEQLDKLVAMRMEGGATAPTSPTLPLTFDDYDVQFLAESLAEDRSWLPHGSHVETQPIDTSTPLSRAYGPTYTDTATSISLPIIGTCTPPAVAGDWAGDEGRKASKSMCMSVSCLRWTAL